MAVQTKKYVKLIMVSSDNNNKYYEMFHEGGTQFSVKYGRVESTAVTGSYDMEEWDKKYREKIKKGYKDVTQFVTTEVIDTPTPDKLGRISDNKVEEFMTLMKAYTDNLVKTTYSVKSTSVTQAQVDAAQNLINKLNNYTTVKLSQTSDINDLLIALYTTIPRKMSNTRDHLIPNVLLKDIMQQEQDNLDAISSQVMQNTPKTKKAKAKKVQTLLDVLGINMTLGKTTQSIEYLVKQLTGRRIEAIFEVNKPAEDIYFEKWLGKQKNKSTRILLHGTRCTSVLPILEIGLKIRPAGNYQFSGKVYGDSNYFSETCSKSLGYTGNNLDKVLLVYEVHVGNPFIYQGWFKGNSFKLCYEELSKRGYDSLFVQAGNGLLNSEICAYREEQCRIKNIIWLKN